MMKLFASIAAHKVIAALVTAAVVGGPVGGVGGVTNPIGNTCNSGCSSSVPVNQQGGQTYQWKYQVDTLNLCLDNNFLFTLSFMGDYCMTMIVPIRYDGSQVEITTLPKSAEKGLPAVQSATGTNGL